MSGPLSKTSLSLSPILLDESLIHHLIRLAEAAGRDILNFYHEDSVVHEKGDASPLTLADLASHQRILQGLKSLTPHTPILSEESAPIDCAERLLWSNYWLVDPLDGTKEFLKRNGEFTVNIALIEDHAPVFGIVHVPAQGLTYVGQGEKGAFRLGPDKAREPLQVAGTASDPIRVLGSRSHPSAELEAYLSQQGPSIIEPAGSSLKFCRIAEGSADLYPRFGLTSEWDTGAGQAVLEAAGGRVIDLQGNRLRYNLKSSLLNPYFLAFGDLSRSWLSHEDGS